MAILCIRMDIYMKEEWNNECPYDFKNINFKNMQILFNETERDRLKCCDMITDYDWFQY